MAKIKLIIGPTNKVGDDYKAVATATVTEDGKGNNPKGGEDVVFRFKGTDATKTETESTTPEGIAEYRLSSKTAGVFQLTATVAHTNTEAEARWTIPTEKKNATADTRPVVSYKDIRTGPGVHVLTLTVRRGEKSVANTQVLAFGTDNGRQTISTDADGVATIVWDCNTVPRGKNIWITFVVGGNPAATRANIWNV